MRDKKPKSKMGRPKSVYKKINELTQEDRRILKLIMEKKLMKATIFYIQYKRFYSLLWWGVATPPPLKLKQTK